MQIEALGFLTLSKHCKVGVYENEYFHQAYSMLSSVFEKKH